MSRLVENMFYDLTNQLLADAIRKALWRHCSGHYITVLLVLQWWAPNAVSIKALKKKKEFFYYIVASREPSTSGEG